MAGSSNGLGTTSDADSYDCSDHTGQRAAPTLPDDVLILITSFLPDDFDERRRTLSRLCLVRKRFYAFFNLELYRRIRIDGYDLHKYTSSIYRLITHLALRPIFQQLIHEVVLDRMYCDYYRLTSLNGALNELNAVEALDLPALAVPLTLGRHDEAGKTIQDGLRRLTVRAGPSREMDQRYIERVRLLPLVEFSLFGGVSFRQHLSVTGPPRLEGLDVEMRLCPPCLRLLTDASQETLTRLSILVCETAFDLSPLVSLRSLVIMGHEDALANGLPFFAAVSSTLASMTTLPNLRSLALVSSTGERVCWPNWIPEEPSLPFHLCLPESLFSLDIADARFDYDDLIPLTNKQILPSLRRLVLSKDTLAAMTWPFNECEPELIKSTVEGHAANRGVLVEWVTEA